jgi:hypothetical protein
MNIFTNGLFHRHNILVSFRWATYADDRRGDDASLHAESIARQFGNDTTGYRSGSVKLTRNRRDSGSLRKSAGLTTAGEIGAGPFSSSDAFPAGLSNS